ncbi:MAG: ribonuclease E/G, partial [Burkholderiales bacterium]|nr:ribonuclease E/G [Burkholderiales bacterium]
AFADTEPGELPASPQDEASEAQPAGEGETAQAQDGRRGRRRGRDRFRREPREGGAAADAGAEAVPEAVAGESETAVEAWARSAGAAADAGGPAGPQPTTRVESFAEPGRRPEAPTPAPPYVLPTETLHTLATEAGLQWVESDTDKVLAAQAAIAAEPAPIRIPRAPRPAPVVDEGPLILVETRIDLAQMKLPFEQPGAGSPAH